jgi:hypothetical protein
MDSTISGGTTQRTLPELSNYCYVVGSHEISGTSELELRRTRCSLCFPDNPPDFGREVSIHSTQSTPQTNLDFPANILDFIFCFSLFLVTSSVCQNCQLMPNLVPGAQHSRLQRQVPYNSKWGLRKDQGLEDPWTLFNWILFHCLEGDFIISISRKTDSMELLPWSNPPPSSTT